MSYDDELTPEGWPRQHPQPGQGQPQPPQYTGQPGYVYPQPLNQRLQDNSAATLSMVLGIIGLGSCLAFLSPFAWAKGSQALEEIDANPGVYGNRGMAVAGQITGIIGTVLLGLGLLFGVGILIMLVASSN